jgi:hypothetical protein
MRARTKNGFAHAADCNHTARGLRGDNNEEIKMFAVSYDVDARKPANVSLPDFNNKEGLIRVLDHLGFNMPVAVTQLAAANKPLGATGCHIELADLDAAMTKAGIRTIDRIRLKAGMAREGLLK